MSEGHDEITAALAPFGWTCGPEFFDRYYRDAWVFNLTNAVVRLTSERDAARAIRQVSTAAHVADTERLKAEAARAVEVLEVIASRIDSELEADAPNVSRIWGCVDDITDLAEDLRVAGLPEEAEADG